MKRAKATKVSRAKVNRKKIEERLTQLERRLLGQMDQHLGNVQNTSSSDPSELLDMVSEGEMDYMAAISAQAGSATIDEIELALKKLRDGTYGICEECGSEIMPRRLRCAHSQRCACTARNARNGAPAARAPGWSPRAAARCM